MSKMPLKCNLVLSENVNLPLVDGENNIYIGWQWYNNQAKTDAINFNMAIGLCQ